MVIRKLLPSPLAFTYHGWRLLTLLQLIQSPCWAGVLNCFGRPPSDPSLIGSPTQILDDNLPCDPLAARSTCCGLGWACLENGLCLSTSVSPRTDPGNYAAGTCTDPRWESDVCFSPCKGGQAFTICGDGDSYCCGDCSCNKNGTLSIPGRTSPYTTIRVDANTALPSVVTSQAVSFVTVEGPVSTVTISEANPSTRDAFIAVPSASGSATASELDVLSSKTAISFLASSASAPPSSGSKNGVNIGAGVGLGLGIPIIALVLGAIVWHKWRGKKRTGEMQMQSISQTRLPHDYSNPAIPPELTTSMVMAGNGTSRYGLSDSSGTGPLPSDTDPVRRWI